MKELTDEIGIDERLKNPIVPALLVADVNDRDSLIAAFKTASLVLNCSGPYRFLGEPVVEACITAGADYMDITGEPQFMENMFLKYHERAQTAKTLIIHGMNRFDNKYFDRKALTFVSFISLRV